MFLPNGKHSQPPGHFLNYPETPILLVVSLPDPLLTPHAASFCVPVAATSCAYLALCNSLRNFVTNPSLSVHYIHNP